MNGLVIAVGIGVASQYVVAPLWVRASQTIVIRPNWVATDVGQLSWEVQEFISARVQQFHALGFEFRCNVHSAGAVPGVQGFQVLLVNPTTGDIAVLIIASAALHRSMIFVIRSEFADGTWIATGSNPGIGMYPPNPACRYENFAWVQDAATMLEAHRRVLAQSGRSHVQRVAPAPGEEFRYMDYEWGRGNQWAVACGYRYVAPERGVFAFTLPGAFLATWKLSWPIKQLRIALRDRAARRVWQQLGMSTWIAPRPTVPLPLPPPLPPV